MNYTHSSNWYYPITPYHLIISVLLKNSINERQFNGLIFDNNLFDKEILNYIQKNNNWNKIIILNKSYKYFRILQAVFKSKSIFNNITNSRIFIFTPGNALCNSIINYLINKNNEIILSDDGIAPYYFNNINNGWSEYFYYSNKYISNFIKLFFSKTQFQFENNINYLLLNKKISQIKQSNVNYLDLDNTVINSSLNECSLYYSSHDLKINNNINFILFYNNVLEMDLILYNYYKQYLINKNVLHKFRRDVSENYLEKLQINECKNKLLHLASLPWEILYHNNKESFTNTLIITFSFTTAIIDTLLKYGLGITIILINSKLDFNFINIINSINANYINKKIYVYMNLDEFILKHNL